MAGPPRLGITGGIGSGKSATSARFAQHGARVIDADAISRTLTAADGGAIAAVRAAFGSALLDAAGALDRARMRALIFSDPQARRQLEGILHPLILAECLACAEASSAPLIVFEVPLLAESSSARATLRLDRILVIDCPPQLQLMRAVARSGLSVDQARAVIDAQAARNARLNVADDILFNAGTLADLHARVDQLWSVYGAGRSASAAA